MCIFHFPLPKATNYLHWTVYSFFLLIIFIHLIWNSKVSYAFVQDFWTFTIFCLFSHFRHFVTLPSLVINVRNGHTKLNSAVSLFLAPFSIWSPSPTFNQERKRLLLPPSGPSYFSFSTHLWLEEDARGFWATEESSTEGAFPSIERLGAPLGIGG